MKWHVISIFCSNLTQIAKSESISGIFLAWGIGWRDLQLYFWHFRCSSIVEKLLVLKTTMPVEVMVFFIHISFGWPITHTEQKTHLITFDSVVCFCWKTWRYQLEALFDNGGYHSLEGFFVAYDLFVVFVTSQILGSLGSLRKAAGSRRPTILEFRNVGGVKNSRWFAA